MMARPLIYAELLSNIRQISVLVELPTVTNNSTQTTIANGTLTVEHEGIKRSLVLPGEVSSSYQLQKPPQGLREISWRIPLALAPVQPGSEFEASPTAPWSATDLDSSSSFSCRRCQSEILSESTIRVWQDLPSANWAEMMDFWHCHKPTVPKKIGTDGGGDKVLEGKGYSANARFEAKKGIGKVDLMDFLLSEEDCGTSVVVDEANLGSEQLANSICANCKAALGLYEPSLGGYRIKKWTLSLSHPKKSSPSSQPLTHFLLPHLSALSSALAVSKFVIRAASPVADEPVNIYAWLFAPHLTVSFSSSEEAGGANGPIKAAKLFYRLADGKEAIELIDKPDASVEEVILPKDSVAELKEALVGSTKKLPRSASRFGPWDVGILERA